jgi:hypothetical protein
MPVASRPNQPFNEATCTIRQRRVERNKSTNGSSLTLVSHSLDGRLRKKRTSTFVFFSHQESYRRERERRKGWEYKGDNEQKKRAEKETIGRVDVERRGCENNTKKND